MTSDTIPEFPFFIASKLSLSQRKSIYGVGINDAGYLTQPTVNGKRVICPFYRAWKGMMERCYSNKFQARCPTYKGCTVAKEWHLFTNFRVWMTRQDWHGKDLDKDLLVSGNKLYSPETCIFVSHHVNSIFNDHGSMRGKYPQGISWGKQSKKFKAQISYNGKVISLGRFNTAEEAEATYKKAKSKHVYQIAITQTDGRLYGALLREAYSIICGRNL